MRTPAQDARHYLEEERSGCLLPKLSKRFWILFLVGIVVLLILCCLGTMVWGRTDQNCFDFISGRAPFSALERFIDKTIVLVKEDNYQTLPVCGRERYRIISRLGDLELDRDTGYTIRLMDTEVGGYYSYVVVFDNNARLYLELHSIWPRCPDLYVTDQELLENICIESVAVEAEIEP